MDDWNVYKVTIYDNCIFPATMEKSFLGTTSAVSAKKAISNVRYRTEGKVYNRRAYDMGHDCSITYTYEAVLAKEDK